MNLSMTWRSDPGPALEANYVVTSAVAQPSLGRPLSAGNVTVNLVEPGTLYGARINNLDMRVAKVVHIKGTRANIGVDFYNLTNGNTPTTVDQSYSADPTALGARWLRPTAVLNPRFVRFNVQVDF